MTLDVSADPGADRADVAAPTSSGARDAQRVLVLSTTAFTLLFAVWLMLGMLAIPIRKELHLSAVEFAWLTAIAVLSASLGRW